MGNQQTCSFRKCIQRCHSACCVPFRWMVNEGCDCFVVVGGMVRASSKMVGCGLVVVSLEAVLTYIVKCGKGMRSCVVSMTTLLFLIKCSPIFGPVNFFITTKVLSSISNFSVAVDNGFSNWPLATCV